MGEILTRKEVAKLLHCTAQTVKNLEEQRGLPVHYYARTPRYKKSEILAWVEQLPSEKQDGIKK